MENKRLMWSEIKKISPEDAERYLATSRINRKISQNKVSAMARDMADGKWALNGEAIVFDQEGHLVEGHHRLLAVIEANVVVEMYVTYNAPETWIYDNTRPRTARDQFIINGEPDALCDNLMQATIRFHLLTQKGYQSATNDEIREFYIRNGVALNFCVGCVRKYSTFIRKAAIVYAVFSAYIAGVPRRTLKRFCDVAASGNIESPDESPALKLREYLYQYSGQSRANRKALCHVTENVIRDFHLGNRRIKRYPHDMKPVYSNQRIMELL